MSEKKPTAAPKIPWKEIFANAKVVIIRNWPFKLLAFGLAVLLWAGLITQDPSLTRERVFADVPVTVSGSDTLKRNGLTVVTDLNSLLEGVTMRVEVPQMQYQTTAIANYNPRVELNRVRGTGLQTLRITTSSSTTYGSVTEISPATIEVEVEEYITRYRIPVSMKTEGTAPAGFYADKPTLNPYVIAVSGPRSLVEQVARAEVTVDLGNLPAREGQSRSAVNLELQDQQGNPIQSDMLEVTSEGVLVDSVIVEQTLYAAATLSVAGESLLTGTPAKGYEVRSVTVSPANIVVAGHGEHLSAMESLFPEGSVSIHGATESLTCNVRLRKPSELVYLSADSVNVTVEIAPIQKARSINDVKVNLVNIPSGVKAATSVERMTVTISGDMLWVDKLRQSNITLTCDVSGLKVGETLKLPVQCTISGAEGQDYQLTLQYETVTVSGQNR